MTPSSAPTLGALFPIRAEFSQLGEVQWLNTPSHAPGARRVTEAVSVALREWGQGSADYPSWEAAGESARRQFAALMRVDPSAVAITTTLADAAATVAASLVSEGVNGVLLTAAEEFLSNLLPWRAIAGPGRPLKLIERCDGRPWTEQVVEAIQPGTALVAISLVQSASGIRLDPAPVAEQCRRVGARFFLNLTQAAGVIDCDLATWNVDYAAAHGYKWLLAPRGASWLYVRPDRLQGMEPLAPNWKNTSCPEPLYYGADAALSDDSRRLDTSLSWFAWVGAAAALRYFSPDYMPLIEQRALRLADSARAQLATSGYVLEGGDHGAQLSSPILSIDVQDARALVAQLRGRRMITSARSGRLRAGFHAFNDEKDVETLVDALRELTPR